MDDETLKNSDSDKNQREAELQAAMNIVHRAIDSRSPNLNPFVGYSVLFTSLSLVVAVSVLSIVHHSTVGMLGVIGLIGGIRTALLYGQRRKEYESALKIIGSGEIRTVTLLIRIIKVGDNTLKNAARDALSRILSEKQKELFDTISAENKRWFREQLIPIHAHKHPDFAMMVLQAFKTVGVQYDRKAVKLLAELRPRNETEQQLCEAAQQCLALIDARNEKIIERKTLLRASSAVSASPDALLRPASAAGQTHEAELLRPVENEQAE